MIRAVPAHEPAHLREDDSGDSHYHLPNGSHHHPHLTVHANRADSGPYQQPVSPSHWTGQANGHRQYGSHGPSDAAGTAQGHAHGHSSRDDMASQHRQQVVHSFSTPSPHAQQPPDLKQPSHTGSGGAQGYMQPPRAAQRFESLQSASSRGSEGDTPQGSSHAWTGDKRAGGALEGLAANQPQGPHAAGYLKKLQAIGLCLSYAATGSCPKGDDCRLVHGLACPVGAHHAHDQAA